MPNKSVSRRKNSTSQKSSSHLMKNVDETSSMPALSKMKVSVILDSLSQLFPQCSRSELYQHILEIIQVEKSNFCNITNSIIISRAAESVLLSESQKCVKRWFEEQSTCPTCRRHCLLDEDYPPLI